MPRKNSSTWNIADPITALRLNDFNEDLDDIYTNGDDRGRIQEAASTTALKIDIAAFAYRVGNSSGLYAGGTDISVTDAATNYVEIDDTGTIQINTTGWTDTNARLWKVIAASGAITSIEIWKADVVGGELGGGYPKILYASTPQAMSANTSYTFTHNLGLSQTDFDNGKYRVVLYIKSSYYWSGWYQLPNIHNWDLAVTKWGTTTTTNTEAHVDANTISVRQAQTGIKAVAMLLQFF